MTMTLTMIVTMMMVTVWLTVYTLDVDVRWCLRLAIAKPY